MMGLIAMVICVLECAEEHVPTAVVRGDVDDLSAIAQVDCEEKAVAGSRQVHRLVKVYEGLDGAQINAKKCLTYGDSCFDGA